MDGDTSVLALRVDADNLDELFADPELVGNPKSFAQARPGR